MYFYSYLFHCIEKTEQQVSFYQKLNENNKQVFEERVRRFLAHTVIKGIGTEVTDADKVFVAAGAIIPIFAFPDWEYRNIDEVLIYKNTFNKDFSQTKDERNILGMVGDSVMNNTMSFHNRHYAVAFKRIMDTILPFMSLHICWIKLMEVWTAFLNI